MSLDSASVPILEGREFREFWEEHLTEEARAAIETAVRKGEGIDDLGLASAAVSLARQNQRTPMWAYGLLPILLVLWTGFFLWLMTLPATLGVMIWRLVSALWVFSLPVKLVIWYRVQLPRYRQAEERNLERLQQS